jgi:hypothetical protein
VVRDQALVDDVVLVEADVRRRSRRRPEALARGSAARHADLDHEAAARLEVRADVLEARDLRVLRGQVVDRVEDEVGEAERALDAGRGEIADRDRDRVAAGLGAEPATIASERSIPCTSTPRAASGSAIRPVPIPSSRARPSPASTARKSTAGSISAGRPIDPRPWS